MMVSDGLRDLIISTRNRCNIALRLIQAGLVSEPESELATILEDLYAGSQAIIDCYCIWEEYEE